MYCNSCGKPNPDGSAFCSSCGKPLAGATQQAQPAPQPAPTNSPAVNKGMDIREYDSLFRRTWRQMAAEPFALVLIIVYSINVLVNFIYINDMFSSLQSLLFMSDIPFDLIKFLLVAPGVLTAIGMWMLYADAQDRSDRPIKTTGLTMVLVVQYIGLAVLCIGGFGTLISSCSTINDLPYWYNTDDLTRGMAIYALILVAVIAVMSFYIKLIRNIRDAADSCSPNTDCAMGIAVLEFISAGILAIVMITSGDFSIGAIMNAAMPVLVGIMLLTYKEYMQDLRWKKKQVGKTPSI